MARNRYKIRGLRIIQFRLEKRLRGARVEQFMCEHVASHVTSDDQTPDRGVRCGYFRQTQAFRAK